MKTNERVTPEQMTVIGNIQGMEQKIGGAIHTFAELSNQSYDWLHEHQNSLIEPYNQAVRNKLVFGFTKEEKNYIFGFKNNAQKPKNIEVEYEVEGWSGGKHVVHATVKTSMGTVKISFHSSDMWGYVNGLGLCELNGEQMNTSKLIGTHKYSRNESNLLSILSKLSKL